MALVLLQFIPLSLAAITPTMTIFVTALMAHDGNAKRALAVVAGRLLGLLIFGFLSLFVLRQIPEQPIQGRLDQTELIPVIFLVLGIALMLAAGYTIFFGHTPGKDEQPEMTSHMQHLSAPVLFGVFLFSTFISVRQLSLIVAGTAIIKQSKSDWASELLLLVLLGFVMIWPVWVPVAIKFGMGERGDAKLERFRDWIRIHQRGINALVLAFLGGMLVAKGISGLPS
ncbi:MAG: GAP family protein [Thermomicrobiales bacterium]|nr:GAP family protein [Thermomicrobiales bacterium]MCO5222987.1 GAP family protein [Thermomicrobiales bacterium]